MCNHKHMLGEYSAENVCGGCGVSLCDSASPTGLGCNLEMDHAGDCMNTFFPESGTWRKELNPLLAVGATSRFSF